MAATMPELVDYAYIAEKLNVSQQTVRVYATGTKQRKEGFPKSALPEGARSPLFHKKDADAFIKRRERGPEQKAAKTQTQGPQADPCGATSVCGGL